MATLARPGVVWARIANSDLINVESWLTTHGGLRPWTVQPSYQATLSGQCIVQEPWTFSHARGTEHGSVPSCPFPAILHDGGPNLVETRPRLVENLPLGRLRCLCALRWLLSHKIVMRHVENLAQENLQPSIAEQFLPA